MAFLGDESSGGYLYILQHLLHGDQHQRRTNSSRPSSTDAISTT